MNYARLNPQFFIDHPPQADFYHKWQSAYEWHDQCLPLYEWNGIVYVGCTQTTQQLPKNFIPLICAAADLKKCWETYQDNPITQPDIEIPPAEPVAVTTPNTDFILTEDSAADEIQLINPVTENQDLKIMDLNNDSLEILTDLPQDLQIVSETASVDKAKSSHLELHLSSEVSAVKSSAKNEDDPFAALEKTFIIEPPPNQSQESTPEEILDLQMTGEVRATPVTSEPIHTAPLVSEPAKPAPVAAAPAPTPAPSTTSTAQPVAKPAPAAKINPLPPTAANLKPTSTSTAAKENPQIQEIFKELKYHYSKAMILIKEQGHVKPWKWDSEFHPLNKEVSKYALSTPSPFRIVDRTHKSYHGYVVANDISDRFFEEWNESKTPMQLTVSPVLNNEQVVAVLLAIGDKNANTKKSLQLCESLALKLSQYFKTHGMAA